MAAASYRDILSDIKKGNFKPIYILMGEEAYYIDLIAEALENSVVDPDDRDFNMNVYYGADADLDVVAGAAQQLPLMADRKLVMLKEAQGMINAKNALDKLAPYASHANQSTVLVITFKGEKLNATSALVKAVSKNGGVVFTSTTPPEYQLAAAVKDYCMGRKTGIDDKAVAMLVEFIGAPLSKLVGEINKLIQISGGARITPELVEKNVGISRKYNNFELQRAIENRDYPRCISIINYFKANSTKNPTVITTGLLYSFFSKLVTVHFLADKSDSSIMQALELKSSYAMKGYRTGLANYSARKAVDAIHLLRDFDKKSKGVGSFQKEHDLLQELIFKIMT